MLVKKRRDFESHAMLSAAMMPVPPCPHPRIDGYATPGTRVMCFRPPCFSPFSLKFSTIISPDIEAAKHVCVVILRKLTKVRY